MAITANVMFKRGLSTNLKGLQSKDIIDGSFYLTTDTNRLYIGQSDGATTKLVELNKSITISPSLADLPTVGVDVGQFYYCQKENILAYYGYDKAGNNLGWHQINPDTTLVPDSAMTTVSSMTGGVTVTDRFADTAGKQVSGSFGIIGDGDVVVSQSGNSAKVSVAEHKLATKTGSNDAGIYTGHLVLKKGEKEDPDKIDIVGTGGITVTTDANNTITIGKLKEASGYNLNHFAKFGSTAGVQNADKSGNLATGELQIGVHDNGGWVTSSITPTIVIGGGTSGKDGQTSTTPVVFDGGTATLPVYTVSQVNSLLNTIDSMHFKGVLTDPADLPAITEAQNGDTYKIGTKGSYDGISCDVGDLLIAFGTEDPKTNKISTGVWQLVPSGDDQTIRSELSATPNNKLSIKDQDGNIGSISIPDPQTAGQENLSITSTIDAETGKELTVNVVHVPPKADAKDKKEVIGSESQVDQSYSENKDTRQEFEAVTKLIYDANGHIITAEKQKVTLKDTHTRILDFTNDADDSNSGSTIDVRQNTIGGTATINTKIQTTDDTKTTDFQLKSDSLRIMTTPTAGTAESPIAPIVQVDMIWGSF